MTLERLVYESTATGTTESLRNLSVILAESQRNNDRRGLTGALAAHDDRYIQVIEGPREVLDHLLRRLGPRFLPWGNFAATGFSLIAVITPPPQALWSA